LGLLAKLFQAIDARDYIDMVIPRAGRGGVIKGDAMQELVRILTHDKTFEQTKIPFSCTAVDAETGELIIFHKEKKLHECVRASMSIPGLFMPVRIDGRLCVDGGVLERVPCIPLRESGADVVIGVDVGYRGELRRLERLTARGLLDNVVDIMQWQLTKLRIEAADVMIVPNVREIMKGFSTGNTMEGIEEGRRAAEAAMPEILALLKERDIPLRS
jgi:NTE family protein